MSQKITVELPDGTSREYASGTTPAEVAASIGTRLAQAALAAKADGEWIDLARPLDHDVALQIVVPDTYSRLVPSGSSTVIFWLMLSLSSASVPARFGVGEMQNRSRLPTPGFASARI